MQFKYTFFGGFFFFFGHNKQQAGSQFPDQGQGWNLRPPALAAQSPSHWATAREFPGHTFFIESILSIFRLENESFHFRVMFDPL